MESSTVAARFLAFTCFLNAGKKQPHSAEDAGKYARRNWKRFLPYVHEDLEKLVTAPHARPMRMRGKAAV
jgi:hypothetical protein